MLIYFTHYTHMCVYVCVHVYMCEVCVYACVYVWGVCVWCSRVPPFQLCLTLSSLSSILKVSYDRENKVCSWHWYLAYDQLLFFYLEVACKGLFPWIWFNLCSLQNDGTFCLSICIFLCQWLFPLSIQNYLVKYGKFGEYCQNLMLKKIKSKTFTLLIVI